MTRRFKAVPITNYSFFNFDKRKKSEYSIYIGKNHIKQIGIYDYMMI